MRLTRATRTTAATAALLAVLTAGGCSNDPEPAPAATAVLAPIAPVTPTSSATPPLVTDPSGPAAPATRTRPVNQVSIDATQTARTAAAAAAAEAFMRAYARPNLSPEQWHATLAPLLTPAGRDALQLVDPHSVTASKVTGRAVVLPGADAAARTVAVPTNGGDFTLLLRRDAADTRWLVLAVQPPDPHHDE